MLLATAMEMIGGGLLLLVAGLASGEWGLFHFATISTRSFICLLYLSIFGSLISFSAYIWLLKVTAPGHVATYAYVNPVIAVFLGWLVAGEPITIRLLLAAAVILFAVVVITIYAKRRPSVTS
jgi:drug/metabolite transporter (DMT)-like permease